jgi:hypothetical protein
MTGLKKLPFVAFLRISSIVPNATRALPLPDSVVLI